MLMKCLLMLTGKTHWLSLVEVVNDDVIDSWHNSVAATYKLVSFGHDGEDY